MRIDELPKAPSGGKRADLSGVGVSSGIAIGPALS